MVRDHRGVNCRPPQVVFEFLSDPSYSQGLLFYDHIVVFGFVELMAEVSIVTQGSSQVLKGTPRHGGPCHRLRTLTFALQ